MNQQAQPQSSVLEVQQLLNKQYLGELAAADEFDAIGLHGRATDVAHAEREWMHGEEARCDRAGMPTTPGEFDTWYRALFKRQIDASEAFFHSIAHECSIEQLSMYVCFEEQVDGRFDDVIALAQLGLKGNEKLALASNFWDEMGEGQLEEMHTILFNESAKYFSDILRRSAIADLLKPTPAALANGNILMLLALRRKYSLRLLGALTLLEQTAPHRFSKTVQGMRRLGVPESVIYYHEMHVRVDAKHGHDLLNKVIGPMIQRTPSIIGEIALGALTRFNIATDYYKNLEHLFQVANLRAERASESQTETVQSR